MEPGRHAFIIPGQLSKCSGPLLKNTIPGGPADQRRENVVLSLLVFRNPTEYKNIGAVNMSTFKWPNHLYK